MMIFSLKNQHDVIYSCKMKGMCKSSVFVCTPFCSDVPKLIPVINQRINSYGRCVRETREKHKSNPKVRLHSKRD